jgi:hypothetical protein
MNGSHTLEPNPIIWSARDRWLFGGVSAALGLIWGVLGVLLLSTFGLLWSDFAGERNSVQASFAMALGMAFGAVHAGKLWCRSIKLSAQSWVFSRHDYVHLSITWGFRIVLLGVLWGSVLVVPFRILWEPSFSLPSGSVLEILVRAVLGLMALWLSGLIPGMFVGVLSVVPVGLLMAPVTILVWRKTFGVLESRRGPDQA